MAFQQDGVETVYRTITEVTKAPDQQIRIGMDEYYTETGAYIFSLEGEDKVSAAFDRATATATIAWIQA